MKARDYSLILVASVPPPVAGQSIATAMLTEHLDREGIDYRTVDLSRPFHLNNPILSYCRRLAAVSALPFKVMRQLRGLKHKRVIFYLQLGQSTAAMVRDIPLLTMAIAKNWPIAAHIHGGGFRNGLRNSPRVLHKIVTRLLSRIDQIIVLSPILRNQVSDYVEADRVCEIYNGVEMPLSEHAVTISLPPRQETGLTVVYLSNLIESKGYITVLKAARICQERGLPHQFLMAGSETETTVVSPEQYIKEHQLDNLKFLGPVMGQDKLALLARSDLFLLPTSYPIEGQPISILEAMHYGLPVLTTGVGGIRDIIKDGVNGLEIDATDPLSIVHAIERLHGDRTLFGHIADCNRRLAAERYTSRAHGDSMVQLFDRLADGAHPC